jgi:hypothetical protein
LRRSVRVIASASEAIQTFTKMTVWIASSLPPSLFELRRTSRFSQ